MTLGELFSKEVVTAESTETIGDVSEKMANRHVGAVVILEDDKPVGIVTDRDIALGLGASGMIRDDSVSKVMTFPVTTIGHRKHILAATKLLRENGSRRLPIVNDQGRLVGMVSADDLVILLGRELFNVAQAIAPEVLTAKCASHVA